MKNLLTAALASVMFLANCGHLTAQDMDANPVVAGWGFLEGTWNVVDKNGERVFTVKLSENKACYTMSSSRFEGMMGMDRSNTEMNMLSMGFHIGGAHSVGRWKRTGDVVEGSFDFTPPDGETIKATGRWELKDKDQFTYSINDKLYATWTRK